MYYAEYRCKLNNALVAAMDLISGIVINGPPALLKALEGRVQRRGSGGTEELRVYYSKRSGCDG